MKRVLNDPAELAALYERYNCSEIAAIKNISFETVRRRIHEYNITMRKRGQRSDQDRMETVLRKIRRELLVLPPDDLAHVLRKINERFGK